MSLYVYGDPPRNFNTDFSRSWGAWSGTLGYGYQRSVDETGVSPTQALNRLRASVAKGFQVCGFGCQASSGLSYNRRRARGADEDTWTPTAALSMSRGPHALSLSSNYTALNRLDGVADVSDRSVAASYSFRRGRLDCGLEGQYALNAPHDGEDTATRRLAVFVKWHLAGRIRRKAPSGSAPTSWRTSSKEPRLHADMSLVGGLVPGMPTANALAALERVGLRPEATTPGVHVVDAALLTDAALLQRLALVHAGEKLTRVILVLEPATTGVDQGRDIGRAFSRVLSRLERIYGQPAVYRERGDFGPLFAVDVNRGHFVRIFEWRTEHGTTIRFGVPRRLDGVVRFELHHAVTMPPLSDGLWSVEAVR